MQDQTAYAEHSEKAPSPFLMMLEGRAFLEGGIALAALPWLRQAPEGDGHPVLVLPGLGANDVSTVPLRNYLRERGPLTENIEIQASHVGMGVNPAALFAIADRLAQPEDRWQRFTTGGARRWFYKTGA